MFQITFERAQGMHLGIINTNTWGCTFLYIYFSCMHCIYWAEKRWPNIYLVRKLDTCSKIYEKKQHSTLFSFYLISKMEQKKASGKFLIFHSFKRRVSFKDFHEEVWVLSFYCWCCLFMLTILNIIHIRQKTFRLKSHTHKFFECVNFIHL